MPAKKSIDKHFSKQLDLAPPLFKNFVVHMLVIRGRSQETAKNYFHDIILLFRYLLAIKCGNDDIEDILSVPNGDKYNDIISDISSAVDDDFIKAVTRDDIKNFVFFMSSRQIKPSTRNRRLASIRSFFEYCIEEEPIIEVNPCTGITNAQKDKKLPKCLSLDEANKLLDSVAQGLNYERDYCILTLFLNTGMRISELVGMDINDIKDNTLRIMGKGAKERSLYLNTACMSAIESYLKVRFSDKYRVTDKNAMFISSTTGKRLTVRAIQLMVSKTLKAAGLDGKGYSPHKFRHTAATLMYQYGGVDVLTLKDILGHEDLSTTQIYTHVNNKQVKEALEHNPLAHKGTTNQEN